MDEPQPGQLPRLNDCMIACDEAEGRAARDSHIQYARLP